MSRGPRIATQLREELFLEDKLELSVLEDICLVKNTHVKFAKIDGAQGRILFSKNSDSSIITINNTIGYEPKKKFVLAHELGHRLLHFQLMNFICGERELSNWGNANGHFRYEKEANEFAAALLMPKKAFQAYIDTSALSGGLIKEVANKFGTSLTSAGIYYVQYGNFPCYLIHSRNGNIQWVFKSDDIDWGYIKRGEQPPSNSTPRCFFKQGKKKKREIRSVFDWFPDYSQKDFTLFEESIYLETYSSVLTFLWPYESYN